MARLLADLVVSLAALVSELLVMLLAGVLMAVVVLGPERDSARGAILLAFAVVATAMAAAHHWLG